ncbi:MAG: hppD [Hydrocarboniphaga sp.]|uniref:4-hydroxyphenylpyruvate dioxygenase n=1 Tax=Hydrocarboniphaga sp. TaxID=2033016 RepID=UPI002604A2EC|nr:4-hydroxyphenylpyruvate dioxygenase [Hydrocarboniphaga sp.]MDB5972003.1 hppD [Hydrocarboniphaga sp.]
MQKQAETTAPADAGNPLGTDGFEFVEFTAPDPAVLDPLFRALGFTRVAEHRSKRVALYRQGGINFILNGEPSSLASNFAHEHGPSACAMAFRVRDARFAFEEAVRRGAKPIDGPVGPMELRIPAIEGIGGAPLYLVDRYEEQSIYDVDFRFLPGVEHHPAGVGLTRIDHLTHNVERGRMAVWAGFYERLFNFHEIRHFDIEGQHTGLASKAMTGPCGKLRIPINESADDRSQIAEYLHQYRGEGIQHIALATDEIYATVDRLRALGLPFLAPPPDTYYEGIAERLPRHGENVEELRKRGLLIDGAGEGRVLLQIFTETQIGPIFFEIIQRKGDEGFGEGNFKALFESMERDQIRRGSLSEA